MATKKPARTKKPSTTAQQEGPKKSRKREAPTPIRFPRPMLERLDKETEERGVSRARIVTDGLQLWWELNDGGGELWETLKARAAVHDTTPGKLLADLLAKVGGAGS